MNYNKISDSDANQSQADGQTAFLLNRSEETDQYDRLITPKDAKDNITIDSPASRDDSNKVRPQPQLKN